MNRPDINPIIVNACRVPHADRRHRLAGLMRSDARVDGELRERQQLEATAREVASKLGHDAECCLGVLLAAQRRAARTASIQLDEVVEWAVQPH
jgi:hypothetical protein